MDYAKSFNIEIAHFQNQSTLIDGSSLASAKAWTADNSSVAEFSPTTTDWLPIPFR